MPKLKIVQPGWETYTGNLGGFEFVDAVSNDDIPLHMARRLAAIVQTEEVGTGANLSVTQQLIDQRDTPMDAYATMPDLTQNDERTSLKDPTPHLRPWTKEALEKIAGEKGIAGIREIADAANIKGKNINTLIAAITTAGVKNPTPVVELPAGNDATIEAGFDGEGTLSPSIAELIDADLEAEEPAPTPAPVEQPGMTLLPAEPGEDEDEAISFVDK